MLGRRPTAKRADLLKNVLGKLQATDQSNEMARKLWTDLRWQIQTTATNYDDICAKVNAAIVKAQEIPDETTRALVIVKMREMQRRASEFSSAPEEFAPDQELIVCSKCQRECGDWHADGPGGLIFCKECAQ